MRETMKLIQPEKAAPHSYEHRILIEVKPRCNANACRPFNEPTTAKQIDFQPFMTTGSMLLKKFYSHFVIDIDAT